MLGASEGIGGGRDGTGEKRDEVEGDGLSTLGFVYENWLRFDGDRVIRGRE